VGKRQKFEELLLGARTEELPFEPKHTAASLRRKTVDELREMCEYERSVR